MQWRKMNEHVEGQPFQFYHRNNAVRGKLSVFRPIKVSTDAISANYHIDLSGVNGYLFLGND